MGKVAQLDWEERGKEVGSVDSLPVYLINILSIIALSLALVGSCRFSFIGLFFYISLIQQFFKKSPSSVL